MTPKARGAVEQHFANVIGMNIRVERTIRRLTQQIVAGSVGVSPSQLCRWERHGYRGGLACLDRLAQCFGIPITALIESRESQATEAKQEAASAKQGVS